MRPHFLPGAYAGTYVNIAGMKPDAVIPDLKNPGLSRGEQRRQTDLLASLNRLHLDRRRSDHLLEAGIEAMEMAFRMQFSVPGVFDLSLESPATLDLYGESEFAKGCLLARRMVERGVRVVQLNFPTRSTDTTSPGTPATATSPAATASWLMPATAALRP